MLDPCTPLFLFVVAYGRLQRVTCARVKLIKSMSFLFPTSFRPFQGVQQAEAVSHPVRRGLLLRLQHPQVLRAHLGLRRGHQHHRHQGHSPQAQPHLHQRLHLVVRGMLGHLTGCRAGNGEKLSGGQAEPGQAIKSAVA